MDSTPIAINLEVGQAEQLLNLLQSGLLDGSGIEHIRGLREATIASILRHKREAKAFDVFLCHNSINKAHVKRIGERLKAFGLLPWLDEWELRPGILRWVPFTGQFRPLTSLTLDGKDRVRFHYRPHWEFCPPVSCAALHGST
ncbi:MAG: toll/interleukin-1 receptor domain-containing protein, partial [Cyanobacteriota bacterium]